MDSQCSPTMFSRPKAHMNHASPYLTPSILGLNLEGMHSQQRNLSKHQMADSRVRYIFACDRNKPPPSCSTDRVRRTSSRRTGCRFSVLAKQSLDGSTWVLAIDQISNVLSIITRPAMILLHTLPIASFGKRCGDGLQTREIWICPSRNKDLPP